MLALQLLEWQNLKTEMTKGFLCILKNQRRLNLTNLLLEKKKIYNNRKDTKMIIILESIL